VPDDERRPAALLEAVDAWCAAPQDGTLRERVVAATAPLEALASATGDGVVATAAQASLAAAQAVDDPEDAATAAVAAVQAAVLDAGDCAMVQVVRFVQSRCADHVRAEIDATTIARAYEARAKAQGA
jgi:hypothetical protein